MNDVSGIDSLNINLLRKFPVDEGATLVDDSGIAMDTSLIANLLVVTAVELSNVRISYFRLSGEILSVVASDDVGPVASLMIHGYENYKDYSMTALRNGVTVRITTGKLSEAKRCVHRFSTPEQSLLNGFCVIDVGCGLVENVIDDSSGSVFHGDLDVTFSGGIGAEVDQFGRIQLRATDSLDKTLASGCTPTNLNKSCIVPVIQSINGVKPTNLGDIAIVFE